MSAFSLLSLVDFEEHITHLSQGLMCKICGHVLKYPKSMQDHMQDLHFYDGRMYHCPRCDYTARSRNPFRQHVNNKHKELKGLNMNECIVYPK